MKLLPLLSFLLIPIASANSLTYEDTQVCWEAWASQSFIKTSSNSVSGNSTQGSFDRREIGVLASYELSPSVDLRGLVISDKYGLRTDGTPFVGVALADVHHSNFDYTAGVRIGRSKIDYGFYNTVRLNPSLRDTDFAPQGIYRDQFMYMASFGDGIQAYYKRRVFGYEVSVEAGIARPNLTPMEDTVNVFLNLPPSVGTFDTSSSRVFSTNLIVSDFDNGIVARYDRLDLRYPFKSVSPALPSGDLHSILHYAGVRKYFDGFDLTGEALYVQRTGSYWDSLIGDYNFGPPITVGVSARFNVGPNTTVTVGENAWYTNWSSKDGTDNHKYNPYAPKERYYSDDKNIGIKHVVNHWTAKLEYHKIKGTNTLSIVENADMNKMVADYTLISTSLTYKF